MAIRFFTSTLPMLMGSAAPLDEPDEGFYILHVATGERTYSNEIGDLIPEPTQPTPGTITPYLINDPAAWIACFGRQAAWQF